MNIKRRKQLNYDESHKIINEELYKLCLICNEWFPCNNEYFYKNKSNKTDELYPYCKKCTVKKSTIYEYNNYDKLLSYVNKYDTRFDRKIIQRNKSKKQKEAGYYRKYLQNNPEKVKGYNQNRQHKNHKITKEEWEYCKQYFDNCCAYCGLPLEDHYRIYAGKLQKIDFHKEHIDDEGSNKLDNCVPSCLNCNSSKWQFDFEEWYKEQEFYTEERYNKIIKWLNEDWKN